MRGSDSCLNCNTADGPKHPERRITPKQYLQCIPNPCQCPHICRIVRTAAISAPAQGAAPPPAPAIPSMCHGVCSSIAD